MEIEQVRDAGISAAVAGFLNQSFLIGLIAGAAEQVVHSQTANVAQQTHRDLNERSDLLPRQ